VCGAIVVTSGDCVMSWWCRTSSQRWTVS
jgi:hypothetical protein